jgi:hypothetical protein
LPAGWLIHDMIDKWLALSHKPDAQAKGKRSFRLRVRLVGDKSGAHL